MPSTLPTPYRRTLLLDSTGDFQFDGSGNLVMTITDDQKRGQDVTMYLKTIIGEDIFATSMGFDIMAAKSNPFSKPRIDHEIRESIKQYQSREDRPNRIKSIQNIEIKDPDKDRKVEVLVELLADTNVISLLDVNI